LHHLGEIISEKSMRVQIITALIVLLFASSSHAQKIYTWVDANGQKQFSSSPPPGQKTDRVRIRRAPEAPPAPAVEVPKPGETGKPVMSDARKAELNSYCREMRSQITTLSAGGNLTERSNDGKENVLSKEQINSGLADRRAKVAENCIANGM
jgi:Domain of unknown function (DUF4124)